MEELNILGSMVLEGFRNRRMPNLHLHPSFFRQLIFSGSMEFESCKSNKIQDQEELLITHFPGYLFQIGTSHSGLLASFLPILTLTSEIYYKPLTTSSIS